MSSHRHKKHNRQAAPAYPTIHLAYEILRRQEKVILRIKKYGWEAEGPTEEEACTNFKKMMQAKEQELEDPSNDTLFREEKLAYVRRHLAWELQYQREMALLSES